MSLFVSLPDIAAQRDSQIAERALQHVGMRGVAIRIALEDGTHLPATADVGVDLAAGHRGIHMSRLYRLLDGLDEIPQTPATLRALGARLLESQEGISQRLQLALRFDLPLRRPALLSGASGWRHYPIEIELGGSAGQLQTRLTLALDYSSTCPCSTALARNAMARDWRHWAEAQADADIDAGSVADWIEHHGSFPTPHSQRSRATLALDLATEAEFAIAERIDTLERLLATPVQTLVKRIDEQAFAERNGANLMFCEDAARRLASGCDDQPDVMGYRIDIVHAESLHAHDAVATVERDFR